MKFIPNKKLFLVIIFIALLFRLVGIDRVPPALFGDEVDVGYQAYSILKTGKDYYGNPWPLHFHSLAEYRTPLYLYSTVPTVALFGISPLGVRLPAVIFGVGSIIAFYLLIKKIFDNERLALTASVVLTFSPWHIQYSRAGFEVTLLLFCLLLGLYFFFTSKEKPWLLVLSAVFLALSTWVYSTAKLFIPALLIFLTIAWFKELSVYPKKILVGALVIIFLIGAPIAYDSFIGEGGGRFGYISVFTNPTAETEVGVSRTVDSKARGESGTGLTPTFSDRVFHNKFTFWGSNILNNYFESFSTDFLFNEGDLNLRHSIKSVGMFYKVEILALILGIIFLFTSQLHRKLKLLVIFWILIGVFPAAITRDGGRHATRLILVLPPLVMLIAYGLYEAFRRLGRSKYIFLSIYVSLFVVGLIFYQHEFWYHNPFSSERWWHAGYKQSFDAVREVERSYDKVIVSTAGEPPWVFFAAFMEYPPDKWQSEFPIGNDVELAGFGKISHTGKFYFGSPEGGLYDWGQVLDNKTLYLATAKEVNVNLILEPERTPKDLKLIEAIAYPSGEPAYYLFTGMR